ncbi:alanine dehydrogenase [Thiohalophilus sp.]|uniref:alanine dehydrogenase n=1 Tax=Thiohalophilus sp. TaxID=3028392 RepID=UPI002ACD5C6F|nr:alanine dehydrogenase [Thiohalophilus sp.]MDZ7662931.1 alanine dehydrogenase [Thiohalophilus sp.]
MKIGIPREIKAREGRVALIPDAVAELVRHRHTVFIEHNAGLSSGYTDEEYRQAGAQIIDTASELYAAAQMIVKVKEPQPAELALLRPDHLLFSYLHLAAEPELTRSLQEIGLTAVAFETVSEGPTLPLLAPMSDIAGRIASQTGSNLLYQHHGGRGVLLGGVPTTERGHVVILGAGVAGTSAARMAAGMGAQVTVFDRNRDKLQQARLIGPNVSGRHAFASAIEAAVQSADLLIGAVLIPGARAPHLVSAETVRRMPKGSVIIDISVDQGGCIETTRPTSYDAPTFLWEEVVHYGVTNMPGAVPRTAAQALSAPLLPYILRLAEPGWEAQPALAAGLNVQAGKVVLAALQ